MPGNVAATLVQQVGDLETGVRGSRSRLHRAALSGAQCGPANGNTGRSLAQWDDLEQVLTVWDTTQAPLSIRNGLAVLLGLPENARARRRARRGRRFRHQDHDVLLRKRYSCPWRPSSPPPVKWAEDRREHLIASNHERGQLHEASDRPARRRHHSGRARTFLHDTGAYTPYGIVVPIITSTQLPGPYRVPNYYSESRTVYTNKVPVSPYRGAGRPHGCFVMERLSTWRHANWAWIEPRFASGT